ncbi:hypothetical protein [Embleya sp. NBC_00896]|uniref:hypothetical protein n=1 Tax=Embleya sp. NBC_00896 TaxID=2975961 RepID=UPI0038691616|nr:hypothetical protein OG928_16380 [Embleya sp. NBC_00896]
MAMAQSIDAPTAVEDPVAAVLDRYGFLQGCALEAALRYHVAPPGTPLSIATIRELIGVGAHIAARVLRELTEAGVAGARRVRDAATGRLLGRHTEWSGSRSAGDAPDAPPEDPDPAVRALELLHSLADIDDRLAFKSRELRTLVPFVLARLAAGDTEADVVRDLTEDLPPEGRTIKTGLLHHRLTRAPAPADPGGAVAVAVPSQRRSGHPRVRLVECDDCGRPGPGLAPGDLCRHCRTGTEPEPLDAIARARRLEQLAERAL